MCLVQNLIAFFKRILIKRCNWANSSWPHASLSYNKICSRAFLSLSLSLSGQRLASIFPTSGYCCAFLAETGSAAAVSCPPDDQPSPANQRARAPASPATPPCLRANQWVYLISNMVCHCRTLPMTAALSCELMILVSCVCGFVWVLSQAHFSDTEEDCSSRTPVSRQSYSDVKQVRHSSQRSKVRGHNIGEFERTAAHNPTDPAICLLSQVTVSSGARLM